MRDQRLPGKTDRFVRPNYKRARVGILVFELRMGSIFVTLDGPVRNRMFSGSQDRCLQTN